MDAKELSIGNTVYYHISDEIDSRKELDEISTIDAKDLEWLSNHDDPDYKPIPLTEEWILKLGFDKIASNHLPVYCKGNIIIEDLSSIPIDMNFSIRLAVSTSCSYGIKSINSVHELQNTYWGLTGEELTIKE